MRKSILKLPKEHGAWAMLYVPLAVGALVAWRFSLPLLLFALSVSFLFIARESFVGWTRARSRNRADDHARLLAVIYFMLAAVFGAPLVMFEKLYWLAPAGAAMLALMIANAQQAMHREDRTIAGETMAIAGLTMTAPAAYYVATGRLEVTEIWLWLLCALYFASSVFYVKLRVNTINPRREEARLQSWRRCVLYHAFLLGSLVLFSITGSSSLFALAAFLPVLIRSFWYLARPVRQINLRMVGWLEVIYSIVFLIFITLTFRV
jgi:hypothetical protein